MGLLGVEFVPVVADLGLGGDAHGAPANGHVDLKGLDDLGDESRGVVDRDLAEDGVMDLEEEFDAVGG